jgi:hypothetical protein
MITMRESSAMTANNWLCIYSDLLHDAAERWGLPVLPGRPLIGLPPVCEGTGEGIVGNPYVAEPIPGCEVLTFEKNRVRFRVSLFIFNGRWGYSLDYMDTRQGFSYGNFLKFCRPHPTRADALADVPNALHWRMDVDTHVIRWAQTLSEPQQLTLF